jgi:hypothetical protein
MTKRLWPQQTEVQQTDEILNVTADHETQIGEIYVTTGLRNSGHSRTRKRLFHQSEKNPATRDGENLFQNIQVKSFHKRQKEQTVLPQYVDRGMS